MEYDAASVEYIKSLFSDPKQSQIVDLLLKNVDSLEIIKTIINRDGDGAENDQV